MNNRTIAIIIGVLLLLGIVGWVAYSSGKPAGTPAVNAPAANGNVNAAAAAAANANTSGGTTANVNAGVNVNAGAKTSGSRKTGGSANAPLPTNTGGDITGDIGQPMY